MELGGFPIRHYRITGVILGSRSRNARPLTGARLPRPWADQERGTETGSVGNQNAERM
ncbi:MAG TPA: hypothetical protein IGS52_07235 [Oscillatoriaceae cyanobacterium M33_DOE_052]|nr:hypothetical protein [Oscillatoriaceae cyanobacterium M33_DOE_052]